MTAFIVFGYALVSVLLVFRLRSINWRSIGYVDGLLIGGIYYVAVPLWVTIFTGSLSAPGLRAPPFDPMNDPLVTANLAIGLLCVAFAHWISGNLKRKPPNAGAPASETQSVAILLALYFSTAAASFFISGKHNGGHWQHNLGDVLGNSSQAILITNFANVYRAVIFGGLLYGWESGKIRARTFLALGSIVVLFDVLTSFNRITAAYFAIAAFIAFRRRLWATLGISVLLAPAIAYGTSFWGLFRALALNDGFSFASASKALNLTLNGLGQLDNGVDNILNSLAEASNLIVFKFIVNSVPEQMTPLWGWTYALRPLTVFVPSTIWEGKPPVFGGMLGEKIQGIHGLALNSTLFGEAYANFYYLWPIAFLIYIAIFNYLFSIFASKSSLYGFLGAFVAIASWRFDSAFPAIAMLGVAFFELTRRLVGYIITPAQPRQRGPSLPLNEDRRMRIRSINGQ